MDQLHETEKVLRNRVAEQCNANFVKIQKQYDGLSNVANDLTKPSIDHVLRNSGKNVHARLLAILSDSLSSVDKEANFTGKNDHKGYELDSSTVLSLIKNRKLKVSKQTLYTCNIDADVTGNFSFSDYTDAFYNLVYRRPPPSTIGVFNANEHYAAAVEAYWKNAKLSSKDDLSILKDFQADAAPAPTEDPADFVVKNLVLSKLIGSDISPLPGLNDFNEYYNYNNTKKTSLNFEVQKQLRQVYIRPAENEHETFGLLARGVNNDLILKKNASPDVVEYLVVFDDSEMEVFGCQTLHGHVTSQRHHHKSFISKFFAHEIIRLNLRNRLIAKLKRYQNARALKAADVQSSSTTINKFISSLSSGFLWNDWNFFGEVMVPEVSYEFAMEDPSSFLEELGDSELVEMTRSYLASLNISNRSLDTFEDIAALTVELVTSYRTLLESFNREFLSIKNANFLEPKPKAQSDIALSSPARMTPREPDQTPEVDSELHEQRMQLLPKFNSQAKSCEELTSLRDVVSCFVSELTHEPFNTLSAISSVKGVSKTVLNACKGITAKGKNEHLEDTELVLCGLRILDVLVFLLQKSSKSFNSSKDLQTFITASKHKVDSALALSLFQLFYEKSNDTYSIKVLGSKRLMCHTIWLCLYLSPKYTFDFSPLLNFDLKNVSNSMLFNSCVELTSITMAGRSNKNLYRLTTPLLSTSKKINLTSLISTRNKRFRTR